MGDIEPVRDLKIEDLSTRLEAEPSEPVKTRARPLVSELAIPSEPEKVLDSESLSAKLEAKAREPLRDLKKEDFSA